MDITRPGNVRTVKIGGKSFWVPKSVYAVLHTKQCKNPAVHTFARFRSCTVNGKMINQEFIAVSFSRKGHTMENLVAMRALNETLMPMSGPSQNEIHIIAAALIMEKFDLEHPNSGILDTDIVTVKSKRHIYTREATFLASELRQLDIHAELTSLMASLWQDKAVMSSTLDPAPEPSTCDIGKAAAERALLGAGVVEKKRKNLRSRGPRTVTCDDGTSWVLPMGVYYTEKTNSQGPYKSLSLQIGVASYAGSCEVNGRRVRRTVTLRHRRPDINKRAILALRAAYKALFPADEPARYQVHRIVAALVLRAFDQENPGSDILDETVVTVRIARHGFVLESTFVAGDLRMTGQNEMVILTELFLNDPETMSGELEPAPDPASASTGPTTHDSGSSDTASCKRAGEYKEDAAKLADEVRMTNPTTEPSCSSTSTIVGEKRQHAEGDTWGPVSGDNMGLLPLPSGIYLDAEDAGGSKTLRLKVKLGRIWVNGEECVFRKKMKIIGGVALHARNVAALRSLRDDIALGLGASPRVRMIIAAKAFRSWQRKGRDSVIPDSAVVTITDGAGTRTSAGLRPTVVSTAGTLRGVDAEKPRVVQELLRALGGIHSDPEDELESGPTVVVKVVKEADDRQRVEVREGGSPGIEEPRSRHETRDFSAERLAKRKMRHIEDSCRGCGEGVRGDMKKEKKRRKAKGVREVRERNRSGGGEESVESDSAVRKAEKTVIDLASDSIVKVPKKKKRQREGRGSSVCGMQHSMAVEDARKKSKSAVGSTKGVARHKGGAGPPSAPHLEHSKQREKRREQQQLTCSGDSTRLNAPIKGREKMIITGEVGKGTHSSFPGRGSRNSVAQEGSTQESADRKAKTDRNNLAPVSSVKKKKKKNKQTSKQDGSLLLGESTHSEGLTNNEGSEKGGIGEGSGCPSSSSSRRSEAPGDGAQEECNAGDGMVIVDLTADPPVSQNKDEKKTKKKKKKKKKRATDRAQSCEAAGSLVEETNERHSKGKSVARPTDSAVGSTLLPQRGSAVTPVVKNGNLLVKSKAAKLMDWIANG